MITLDFLRNSWFLLVFIGGLIYWVARQDLSVVELERVDTRITSLENRTTMLESGIGQLQLKIDGIKEDLSEYDLVLGYWITGLVDKLGDKLNKELKEDAVVISEIFEVPKMKEIKVLESSLSLKKMNVYLYHPNK